jgi:hypothetical protein
MLKSAFVGILLAIAVGVLAYALAPVLDAVGLYIAPTRILIPVIGPLIPSSVTYRLVPEGGATAGVLLILICALIFWSIIFGATHFFIGTLKRHRSDTRDSSDTAFPPGN